MENRRRWVLAGLLPFVLAPGCEDEQTVADDESTATEASAAEPSGPRGGTSMQSRDGLTCSNRWSDDWGATNCGGTPGVKWRLKVRCWWHGDRLGPWKSGPGSDRITCSLGAERSMVVWG
ncbi:hypothetical protein SAMN02745121_05982 [Nannocystis exedens]|uniref:Uncharacterized protein n=1 Tax=Nannocystis exedens TaxID=54 RepID=A0A1I2EBA7_9BACT|nr:hypothetical protein [Nannocystis exedens]PCC74839.1 hypothetical protein NAEX_07939 [Nannocystis exedens]SFE89989.1 hypothetical protein SAMN02745121_05982 [Nannocystis exedens]